MRTRAGPLSSCATHPMLQAMLLAASTHAAGRWSHGLSLMAGEQQAPVRGRALEVMQSASSMVWRASMVMPWLLMVCWISCMMTARAASMPSTCAQRSKQPCTSLLRRAVPHKYQPYRDI